MRISIKEKRLLRCTAAVIRQIFEAYPRGLTQRSDGSTPLHAILDDGSAECEADLFTWMTDLCPSNMLEINRGGGTPLHIACGSLTEHLGDEDMQAPHLAGTNNTSGGTVVGND